jgi:GxxExxY protein
MPTFEPIPAKTECAARQTIGAAIEVHRVLGPGFLERIYQEALCLELQARGIDFERERPVAVQYRGVAIPGQRIDLIVNSCVVVELKVAAGFDVVHDAQLISYLRTTGLRLRLLLNFSGPTLRNGIRRIVL